jgi:hypothetical protein
MARAVYQMMTPDARSTMLSTRLDTMEMDPDRATATALAANSS